MIKASTAPYAALLLRVSLGIMFLAHVGLKVFVFTIPGFVGYFGSLGLPAILAYAVVALEFFGGLALILGIYAPLVALPLALEMLGTVVFAHGANGWLFTNEGRRLGISGLLDGRPDRSVPTWRWRDGA